jgi:hypothetical protein
MHTGVTKCRYQFYTKSHFENHVIVQNNRLKQIALFTKVVHAVPTTIAPHATSRYNIPPLFELI